MYDDPLYDDAMYDDVYVGVLRTRVPRLACLRPRAWLCQWPSMAHLQDRKDKTPRPPEGAASPGGLPRRGDFYADAQTHEVMMTQAMTTKARRVPAGAKKIVSSLMLRRQGQAWVPEEYGKGFHSSATR